RLALVVDLHAGRDKGRQPSLDLLTALVADDSTLAEGTFTIRNATFAEKPAKA
ncbi:MAG: hypothetical protein IH884_13555, partial [Myxococcales bacterium]|nr:hypothetical protein [Myxococcales bacterium]